MLDRVTFYRVLQTKTQQGLVFSSKNKNVGLSSVNKWYLGPFFPNSLFWALLMGFVTSGAFSLVSLVLYLQWFVAIAQIQTKLEYKVNLGF